MYISWFRQTGYNGTVRHLTAKLGVGNHLYDIIVGIPYPGLPRTRGSIVLRILRDFDLPYGFKVIYSKFS